MPAAESVDEPHGDAPITPRDDLHDSVGWLALGVAVLIGSVTMDRLERQDVNPYTVPGLLPGLLGLAMILLGVVLALRSWRRGAFGAPRAPLSSSVAPRESWRRIGVVAALCTIYCVVLIGHGLPFWIASTVYVTGSILILQRLSLDPDTRRMSARAVIKALAIGVGAAVITQAVFQDLFLVRLP